MGNEEIDLITMAKSEKKTLLERYSVSIDDLSYEYISECTNAKKLERIVLILRCGEQGVYPELTRHAEKRLANIKPTSVILRRAEPVLRRNMLNSDERRKIDDDISDWICKMQFFEKDLNEGKAVFINDSSSQPEIRQAKQDITKEKKTKTDEKRRVKPKRISSCDYAAWDKYDVDTEINRIDLIDEQRRAEMKRRQERQQELNEASKKAHKTEVDKLSLTSTELDIMAKQEREKGDEAFRATDYQEALKHYTVSAEIDNNLITFINFIKTCMKLQCYEMVINQCDTILTMNSTNIDVIILKALTLELLDQLDTAWRSYENVLRLVPTHVIAIRGKQRITDSYHSKRAKEKIQKDIKKDIETTVETIVSQGTVETSSFKHSQQPININICYCERGPGSSRDVVNFRPHVKTSYCTTENNKITNTTDIATNKNDRKAICVSASDSKLSSVAKVNVYENKTSRSQDTMIKNNDTVIPHKLFPESHGAKDSLKKSIFSCASLPYSKKSSVIIEELPNDETYKKPKKFIDSNKTQIEIKNETSLREKRDMPIQKSCINGDKELISPEKDSTETRANELPNDETHEKSKELTDSNKMQIEIKNETSLREKRDMPIQKSYINGDKELISPERDSTETRANELPNDETHEKTKELTDSNKTQIEIKNETSLREKRDMPIQKSRINRDKELISPEKKDSTETCTYLTSEIRMTRKESEMEQPEMDVQKLESIESPYEFKCFWHSLRNNTNLKSHEKLLRSIAQKDMKKLISNTLDGTMLSLILHCLEQHFCIPEDIDLLTNLLYSLSQLNRFSIISMFMDSEDKKVLKKIFDFMEKKDQSKVSRLRQIYNIT